MTGQNNGGELRIAEPQNYGKLAEGANHFQHRAEAADRGIEMPSHIDTWARRTSPQSAGRIQSTQTQRQREHYARDGGSYPFGQEAAQVQVSQALALVPLYVKRVHYLMLRQVGGAVRAKWQLRDPRAHDLEPRPSSGYHREGTLSRGRRVTPRR
jgi:hypothetical protein